MAWEKNITGVAEGSYRSLNGAADESIFQGSLRFERDIVYLDFIITRLKR